MVFLDVRGRFWIFWWWRWRGVYVLSTCSCVYMVVCILYASLRVFGMACVGQLFGH